MGPPNGPRPLGLRVFLRLARWLPTVAGVPITRTLERARTDPAAAAEARASGKAEPEAAMHRSDDGRRLTAQTAEAGRQGHRHAVRELSVVGGPWGFDLADIRVPVGVWHGALDRTVPVASSEHLAESIPGASLTVCEDDGLLSLPVEHAADILAFLVSADGRPTG